MVNTGESVVFIPHVPSRWDTVSKGRVPSLDLNPAALFGSFRVLVSDLDDMHKATSLIKHGLTGITQSDYVLAVGDPVLIAAAIAYACQHLGTVRVLRWSRRSHRYDVVEVTL